jgi:superfamily II DNA or RNA helicase
MEKHWEEFREFSSELLQKMSNDVIRNAIIVKHICEHGASRKGIVFACSVAHAEHLTFLLRKAGRPSATISAETRPAIRQRNLELFKAGNLDFIVNFGIVTTGFDVPSINIIVLARPVTSQVLYEQMLGRGLRGPKFGGTGECLILDFEDNIKSHGRPLAYSRFKWLWDTQ